MSSLKSLFLLILTILMLIMAVQDLLQNRGEFLPSGTPIDIRTRELVGTDEYLYAAVYCFDWEGNIIWESPEFSNDTIEFSGNALFVKTHGTWIDGVALLTLEGEILWHREVGKIPEVGVGASPELFAVGTRTGVLWAFSETGGVLWKYYHTAAIEQVAVAPDSSRVVFADYDGYITCVRDGRVIWSKKAGNMEVLLGNRTIAFAPDSSSVVYGSRVDQPTVVACSVDGIELWSAPLRKSLLSVAVARDGHVIAGCHDYICRFASDGTLLWEYKTNGRNFRLAITPDGDYIVVGSISPCRVSVLDGSGILLWQVKSSNSILAVAISPNGKYVAFVNLDTDLFIFSNPPD